MNYGCPSIFEYYFNSEEEGIIFIEQCVYSYKRYNFVESNDDKWKLTNSEGSTIEFKLKPVEEWRPYAESVSGVYGNQVV